MIHPEIESKLTVVPSAQGAQVSLTNGFPTTAMSQKELVYAAQMMLEAADKIRAMNRADEQTEEPYKPVGFKNVSLHALSSSEGGEI